MLRPCVIMSTPKPTSVSALRDLPKTKCLSKKDTLYFKALLSYHFLSYQLCGQTIILHLFAFHCLQIK